MRHRAYIALLPALLVLTSCRPAPRIIASEVVADAKSAFVVVDTLSLYTLSGSVLTYKESVPLGEKLSLSGKNAIVTQGGRDRRFLEVTRARGTTGWVHADQVVSHVILSVVTAPEAPLFLRPVASAPTGAALLRMTVLAIDVETAGTPFVKVTAYDEKAATLITGMYIRNEGISSRFADVQSAMLVRLAAASQSAAQRSAFLASGIKDYPDSAFIEDLRAALASAKAPSVAPATEPTVAPATEEALPAAAP